MAGHVDVGGGSCKVEYTMDTRRQGELTTFQAKYSDKSKEVRVLVNDEEVVPWQDLKRPRQVVVEWR